MNAPTRVTGFLVVVLAVFGIAYAFGGQVGDAISDPAEAHARDGSGDHASADGHGAAAHSADSSTELPGGLVVTSAGYTLALDDSVARAGRGQRIAFVIEGPDGPVTAYDVEHEKRLHFIAVRRDFTGFQHVHPTLGTDGTWSTNLDLTPGQWRVFADFKPTDAEAVTLGADLSVPGRAAGPPQHRDTRVAKVDGYTVTLTGDLVAGEHSMLGLGVSQDGRPVTDLQPYLGAYGHLVALRAGDLAYLHVHPDGEPGDGKTEPGPDIAFSAEVPSTGSYHLYLDFKHNGVVHTAQFSLDAWAEHHQ
jgi:hypothetical protein